MRLRRLVLIPAVLLVLAGLVFTLQGTGLLKGSAMTGARQWEVIGIVVVVIGLVLGWFGLGSRSRA
jgi:uncharacterized membrane protein YjjP (DUF1212 family)